MSDAGPILAAAAYTDLVVAMALSFGIPAVCALLWRVGTKVEVLGQQVAHLSQRVERLEGEHA